MFTLSTSLGLGLEAGSCVPDGLGSGLFLGLFLGLGFGLGLGSVRRMSISDWD